MKQIMNNIIINTCYIDLYYTPSKKIELANSTEIL